MQALRVRHGGLCRRRGTECECCEDCRECQPIQYGPGFASAGSHLRILQILSSGSKTFQKQSAGPAVFRSGPKAPTHYHFKSLTVWEGSALWNAIGLENRASVTADGSTPAAPTTQLRRVKVTDRALTP